MELTIRGKEEVVALFNHVADDAAAFLEMATKRRGNHLHEVTRMPYSHNS